MQIEFRPDRRQLGIGGAILAGLWIYASVITGPNSEKIDELRRLVEKKTQQLDQLRSLQQRLAEGDGMTVQADTSLSIEARVEKVGRELGKTPVIRKIGDGSPAEASKVEVRLGDLYLRELIDFLSRLQQFPITIQIVRLEIAKQQNVANISLILTDLNL